jgi:hypothetical protein
VLFVGFALLLNTAIFTENLATRNTDPGTDPSISYRAAAEEAARTLLIEENDNATATNPSESEVEARYESSVEAWGDSAGLHGARRARVMNTSVEPGSLVVGTRIEQTDVSRNFTNRSMAKTDWTLASDVDVRDVRFTVERDELETTASDAFRLQLNETGGGSDWNVSVYEAPSGSVTVEARNATDTVSCTASVGSHAVVDVSAGRVNGTACPGLAATLDLAGQNVDVEFENGDEAVGTYRLVVDDDIDPATDPDVVDTPGGGSPFVTYVVYEATVSVTYESTDVSYTTSTGRIAPGEIR